MKQHPLEIDSEGFKKANCDYVDRIERDGMDVVYDATLDTLFIEVGGPQQALSEHLVDNIMIRIDPGTLEVVGAEILDFLDDFVPSNRIVREAVGGWNLRRDADQTITLMEPRYKPAREAVEALISQFTLQVENAAL